MDDVELKSIVESLIFTAEKPVTLPQLEEWLEVKKGRLTQVLDKIRDAYDDSSRGIRLVEVGEGYHFRTPVGNAPWIQKTVLHKPIRLSAANLEVLAIVAYKQPVTRSEIESLRGVDSSHILKTLMDKQLVQMDGKTDEPGRPILYSTTQEFLEFFSLKSIRELPTLKDLEELSAFGDEQSVTNLAEAANNVLHDPTKDIDANDAPCDSEFTDDGGPAGTSDFATPTSEDSPGELSARETPEDY